MDFVDVKPFRHNLVLLCIFSVNPSLKLRGKKLSASHHIVNLKRNQFLNEWAADIREEVKKWTFSASKVTVY